MDTNERLERLRGLLYEPPSAEVWDQLCALFDGWEPSSVQLGLDYALPTLVARWPDELRAPLPAWSQAARAKQHPPAWPLVRAYDLILWDCGYQKIAAIKELRQATWLGLKEAKDLIESPAGTALLRAVGQQEGHRLYQALSQVGSQVELRPHDDARPAFHERQPELEFSLRLLEVPPERKVQCVKVLRDLAGASLQGALWWVNEAPWELYRSDNRVELERWAEALRREGASVEVVLLDQGDDPRDALAHTYALEVSRLPSKIETIKLLRTWFGYGLAEAKARAERLPQQGATTLLRGRSLELVTQALRELRQAGGEGRAILEA
jgi:ribosomal protein L7/L12